MPESASPIHPSAWSLPLARHLLNRAGFGLPLAEADRLASLPHDQAVDRLLDFDPSRERVVEPSLPEAPDFAQMRRKLAGMSEEERREFRNDLQRIEHDAVRGMQDWWLDHMLVARRPLQSKLMLFWHGHFATSAQKVKSARANFQLWQVFRAHAAGNFRSLVAAVGKSPAMLVYLDNQQNRKGHPNENWARELMELFTLGRGHYTENDIREAARAFTGWTQVEGRFEFNARAHDAGVKTVFGRQGAFDGDDVVGLVLEQPSAARFIVRKLWEYFAYENPGDALVEDLAAGFRRDYELKPLLRRIFLSAAFSSDRAIGSQIKSPVQFVLQLVDALDVPLDGQALRFIRMILAGLGQELFFPPNVKGWPGNRAWIDTNTLLLRCNAAGIVVNGLDPDDLEGADNPAGRPRARGLPRRVPSPFRAAARLRKLGPAATAGEAVDRACGILLGRRVDAGRAAVLARALGAFDPSKPDDERIRALVHLVTSMAEYQLC